MGTASGFSILKRVYATLHDKGKSLYDACKFIRTRDLSLSMT
jgi:hypothetical protein